MSWIDVPDPAPRQQRPLSSRAEQVTAAAAVYGAAQLGAMRRMAEDQHHWAEVQYLLAIGWSMAQVEFEMARRNIEARAERMKDGAYGIRLLLPGFVCAAALFAILIGATHADGGEAGDFRSGMHIEHSGQGWLIIGVVGCALAIWRGRAKVRRVAAWREAALAELTASTR
jgi:hypothetical protein